MTRKRIDETQPTIVNVLRSVGASVQSLASIGKGCPDLLVGFRGKNYLLEIKNPQQPESKQQLTAYEVTWMSSWNGQKAIILTAEGALKLIGAVK